MSQRTFLKTNVLNMDQLLVIGYLFPSLETKGSTLLSYFR